MSRPRPTAPLLTVLLCLSALPAAASPATDLFRAASGALSANYYGWSETDRPALISRYAATLDAQCAPHADACTFDQGRAVVREMLLQLHDPHTNIRDAEGAERLREIQEDLIVPRTGLRVIKTALGLLVVGVMPGSPAQAAGVQRFDLLTTVNGKTAVNPEKVSPEKVGPANVGTENVNAEKLGSETVAGGQTLAQGGGDRAPAEVAATEVAAWSCVLMTRRAALAAVAATIAKPFSR